jgi:hypothetical protein
MTLYDTRGRLSPGCTYLARLNAPKSTDCWPAGDFRGGSDAAVGCQSYGETGSHKRYRTGFPSFSAGLNRHALAAATIMPA